jgi:hypothetical protein
MLVMGASELSNRQRLVVGWTTHWRWLGAERSAAREHPSNYPIVNPCLARKLPMAYS